MKVRLLNANGKESLIIGHERGEMIWSINPDLPVVQSLQVDISAIDARISRLQRQRARLTQAIQIIGADGVEA